MRGLTLWDPWAAGIALGWKPIENRPFITAHRGTLAITAAKRWVRDADVDEVLSMTMRSRPMLSTEAYGELRVQLKAQLLAAFHPGCVVAVVRVAGVVTDLGSLTELERVWAVPGKRWWRVTDVQRLPRPVPCRGMQGLWPLPADVEQLVREQLTESGRLDATPSAATPPSAPHTEGT